ncbi:MAG TPA: ATP-binding protein [Polyangiaceae bacterium]|jgi:signal transduction histidine kinase|nr:MAG: Alkaline phosphatase synthesis sensor protein PhoR [Deltaproteobacteria bacterium ADurb.Bin207]HNS97540.1 ATP-binding protein [Polyangiaceae bacterium]HNZ23258.1 ATP-binding protein [Polyangiaceae bacterium]HOD23308.1 ATP-binding protein [Polyangiaceae bacterium]HOE50601.1 ATP-binding protein [Polyangiaceae bacterium]
MKRDDGLEPNLEDLTTTKNIRLEDLVDRDSLKEVITSFVNLFGISVRLFSSEGDLLADAVEQQEVCKVINEYPDGRAACTATISTVKHTVPDPTQDTVHPCFSGARYHIAAITYDGRYVGRIVLGPYLPAEVKELPGSLLTTVREAPPSRLQQLLPQMPRARVETVRNIAEHMRGILDLILFSGHKALLTSQMHLASVRESYRELQDKNQRLQDAYDKLKELDRLKSNFIATISHELRTPLTSIIGYSEMMSEGIAGSLTDEQLEFVNTIRDKGEQLLTLIMSLLDLSKLESGSLALVKSDVDIRKSLDDVVSLLKPNATKAGVQLHVDVPAALPTIRGDANRIRQAVLNLAENAIKFTPSGGQVSLSAKLAQQVLDDAEDDIGFALIAPTRSVIEIRVADTGIGIPENEREKIFTPFYQVDSSSTREYGGTGLGLSIVQRLIHAHDGKISVEPNHPKGSVFILKIPVDLDA